MEMDERAERDETAADPILVGRAGEGAKASATPAHARMQAAPTVFVLTMFPSWRKQNTHSGAPSQRMNDKSQDQVHKIR
jgi:hypothetical protein